MVIEKDVLDQLLAGRDPAEVFSRGGLLDDLKKALSERILNAELDAHLDGDGGQDAIEAKPANRRNGTSPKTVLTGTSKVLPKRSRATAPAPSTRSGSRSISGAFPSSTTRSCRCTPAA